MNKKQQAMEVLIVAHTDCKFEGRIISGSIDSMPVSGLILELKRCLWSVEHGGTRKMYDAEYAQFLKLIEYPCQLRQQAKAIGLNPNSINKIKNTKRHIEDTLIEDGVDRMPTWLFDMCDEIRYVNFKDVELEDIW